MSALALTYSEAVFVVSSTELADHGPVMMIKDEGS